jgi:hypothetical protein
LRKSESLWLALPETAESIRRKFGVATSMLDIGMGEVVLKGPRVVTVICELDAAGMAEHVGMRREG